MSENLIETTEVDPYRETPYGSEDDKLTKLVGKVPSGLRDSAIDHYFAGILRPSDVDISPLLADLESSVTETRESAMFALGNVNSVDVKHHLLAGMDDEAWEVRAAAASYLQYHQGEDVKQALIAAMSREDSDETIKLYAIHGLSQQFSRDVEAQTALLQAMDDEDEDVAKTAGILLEDIQDGVFPKERGMFPERKLEDIRAFAQALHEANEEDDGDASET